MPDPAPLVPEPGPAAAGDVGPKIQQAKAKAAPPKPTAYVSFR